MQDVTQADFQLPTLGPKLKQFTTEVVDGRGFQIIKGVPVDLYTPAESTTVYWGLGTYWGKIVPQNKKAHLIGHVRVRPAYPQLVLTLAALQSMHMHTSHESERVP